MPLGIKCKNAVIETEISNYYAKKELLNKALWNKNWSWLVEELRLCNKALTRFEKPKGLVDSRTVKPVPLTTNAFYGWVANKPEFKYNDFAPDVFPAPPLPSEYKLIY